MLEIESRRAARRLPFGGHALRLWFVTVPIIIGLGWLAMLAAPVDAQKDDRQFARQAERLLDRAEQAVNDDPAATDILIERARDLIPQIGSEREKDYVRAKSLRIEAAAALATNRVDEEQGHLDQALSILQRVAPGSKEFGEVQRQRAALLYRTGRYADSLRAATQAHDVLREAGAARSQSLTLQIMGILYATAGDDERALRYFRQAAEVFNDDPTLRLALQNNIGYVQVELQRYEEAVRTYRTALAIAQQQDNALLQSRILTNIAAAQTKSESWPSARRSIAQARSLAERANGENWLPYVSGVEAQIAAGMGQAEEAANLLDRTFDGRDLSTTDSMFRDFHETAYQTYAALGRDGLALQHLLALKRLDDDAAEVTASAINALIGARFDFANQELQIQRLRAGQLERDVKIAEQTAEFNQRIVVFVTIAAFVIAALCYIAVRNIRRRRDEAKAANVVLTSTNLELEKALAAKSEFLATTSHEIRTPLNGILGMTQVMLADHALNGEVRTRVELMHGAGSTMKAIVDDILDMAKLDSGKVMLRRDPFELRRSLTEVGNVFGDAARSKGLEFFCELDGTPDWALGDEQRVRQIVFNLVSNAVKFTSEGTVTITARVEPEAPDDLVVVVTDTGIGIAPADLEEIFIPFHQVDSSRTRQHSGTGLGLTISREFAEGMGGSLGVESVLREGTVFTLVLPLSLSEANAVQADDTAQAAEHGRIAVYAPAALPAAVARRALQDRPESVQFVENFAEALALAELPGTRALLLVFGPGADDVNLPPLQDLRIRRPDLLLWFAGWPMDLSMPPESLKAAHVADVSHVAELARNDTGGKWSRHADDVRANKATR